MIVEKAQLKVQSKRKRPAVPGFDEDIPPPPPPKPPVPEFNIQSKKIKKAKKSKKIKKKLDMNLNMDSLDLNLIDQLFEENIGKLGTGKTKKKKKRIKVSHAEEYDPSKPNDYEKLTKQKKKDKEEEEMMKIEKEIAFHQSKEKNKLTPKPPPSAEFPTPPSLPKYPPPVPSMPAPPQAPHSHSFPPPPPPPLPMENSSEPLYPTIDEKVIKMMKSQGFKFGQGLGAKGQGMVTPLVAVKMGSNTARIQNSSVEVEDILDEDSKVKLMQEKYIEAFPSSTKVVCLENVIAPDEFNQIMREDIEIECHNIGSFLSLESYVLDKNKMDSPNSLRIFIRFSMNEASSVCKVKMDGRYFNGNKVRAYFYNESDFEKGLLDKPLE